MSGGVTQQHVPMEMSMNSTGDQRGGSLFQLFLNIYILESSYRKINPQPYLNLYQNFTYVHPVSMFFQAAPISKEHFPKTWLNVLYVGLSSET